MKTDTPRVFQFADLEVHEGLQRVRRAGDDIPLPKLSFDLLLALLEAAPNYVSNAQLMAIVWPGLVIGDKTVVQRVKLLRDALGDDREEPRYITGLRGRGYRIHAPVTRVLPLPSADAQGAPTQSLQGLSSQVGTGKVIRWLAPAAVVAVLVFSVLWLWGTRPQPAEVDPTATGVTRIQRPESATTIAVLPFRDLSGNDAYLAQGVPEAVLDALSTKPGLTVIARDSVLRAAERERSVEALSSLLGAGYLVDGSIQRAGESLRVSAQLLDAAAGTQVWAKHFDVAIDDIFAVQDEIASDVANALSIRAAQNSSTQTIRHAVDIEAYLAYLRGRMQLARWTLAGADAAAREFESAIKIDPGFGAAYAALYDARLMAADRRCGHPNLAGVEDPEIACQVHAAREEHQSLIDRALALDPRSGAAYFARAIWADDTTSTRDSDFRRGLELDPSNGRGLTAYAEFLDRTGRSDEALPMLERAIRVDPLSPRAYFWRVMRNPDADVRMLEDSMLGVLEIDPNYVPALQRYAKYRWILHGELAQGIRLIEHALALDPASPWLRHTAIAMYLDIGDSGAAKELQAGAGNPGATGLILLLLYDGETGAAAQAALSGLGAANGKYENWGVYGALRERAATDGLYADSLAYLEQQTRLGRHGAEINIENFRAVPALAQFMILAGRRDDAQELLRRCIRWIDDVHLPSMGGVYALRVKAESLMLLGDTEGAIDALEASFDALDYVQWWYTIDRDPLWQSLADHPRFAALSAKVRQYVRGQALLLDELRAQGVVPRRGSRDVVTADRAP